MYLDAFREKFWNDERIGWWYRQNLFLVAKEDKVNSLPFKKWNKQIYIIPPLFDRYVKFLKSKNVERIKFKEKTHT